MQKDKGLCQQNLRGIHLLRLVVTLCPPWIPSPPSGEHSRLSVRQPVCLSATPFLFFLLSHLPRWRGACALKCVQKIPTLLQVLEKEPQEQVCRTGERGGGR